jgi:hypothetical protein
MACTLILQGNFKEVWIWNKARSCMINWSLEIKDQHPFYRNNPIAKEGVWIVKDSEAKLDYSEWDTRGLQLRISTDHDLLLYDDPIIDGIFKVEIFTSVD